MIIVSVYTVIVEDDILVFRRGLNDTEHGVQGDVAKLSSILQSCSSHSLLPFFTRQNNISVTPALNQIHDLFTSSLGCMIRIVMTCVLGNLRKHLGLSLVSVIFEEHIALAHACEVE